MTDDQPVYANLILRPRGGGSVLEDEITQYNLEDYIPSEETWNGVHEELRKLGFEARNKRVVNVMLGIDADKDAFERTFSTTLETITEDIDYGLKATYYQPTSEIVIPENLKQYVEAVLIPTPKDLLG